MVAREMGWCLNCLKKGKYERATWYPSDRNEVPIRFQVIKRPVLPDMKCGLCDNCFYEQVQQKGIKKVESINM